MRKLLMLATAALAIASLGVPAFAGDRDFTLVNKTGYQIDKVFVGPHSSDEWGDDLMGKGVFADNASLDVSFTGGGSCHWDLRVDYEDGTAATWNNINLCETNKISLYWDAKNQVSRAKAE